MGKNATFLAIFILVCGLGGVVYTFWGSEWSGDW
jgi:hypothetical protein